MTLYQGGEYHLYQYKKYTDVRLVFAPEQQAAFFGGDPDNFTFPRHNLDVCLMRAYENGRPLKPASHLRWTGEGAGGGGSSSTRRGVRSRDAVRWISSTATRTRSRPTRDSRPRSRTRGPWRARQ